MSRCIFFIIFFLGFYNLRADVGKPAHVAGGEGKNTVPPDLLFIENKGQIRGPDGSARPDILYMFRSPEVTVFVHKHGLYYQFRKAQGDDAERAERLHPEIGSVAQDHGAKKGGEGKRSLSVHQLHMQLLGTVSNPQPVGMKRTPYYENYFNIPSSPQGISHVSSFEYVLIKDIYPNIDWALSVEGGRLKYDFIIRPGGRISDIKMRYEGADEIMTLEDGSLTIKTPLGKLTEGAPLTYQQNGTNRTIVESRYSLLDEETVGFAVGDYRKERPLVIDPSVIWASYYGGSGLEYATTTAIDAGGNIYMAGWTGSNDGIAVSGHQNTIAGDYDAFLVKFDAAGNRLWATYYGGMEDEQASQLQLDSQGNVYMAGETYSEAGIAAGGHQNMYGGGGDSFLVKFDSQGSRQWATYYGGQGFDGGHGIAIDGGDNIYLTGITESTTGIASGGFQNSFGGQYDAFLVKFNSAGDRRWATYYGGSGQDESKEGALCVDAEDNVYLAGFTNSQDNIASCGFQDHFGGYFDAFVVKFSPEGKRRWGSYFGGEGFEITFDTRLDRQANLYLVGWTTSREGVAGGGHQNTYGGGGDGFLVKIDAASDMLEEPEISVEGTMPLCPGSQVALSVPPLEGVIYEWRHDGQLISTDGNVLAVHEAGNYTVSLLNACDTVTSEPVAVSAFETAVAPTISASGSLSICEGESVRLSVPEGGEFGYQWLKDGEPEGEDSNELIVAESGLYSLVCTNECGSLTTEAVLVQAAAVPEAPAVYGDAHCGPGSLSLRAEGSGTAEYRWYESAEATDPIPDVTGREFRIPFLETSKTYYVSVMEGNCESRRAAVEAVIHEPPVADAGEDVTISPGEQLQLQAGGGVSYSWSPAEGLSNTNIANPVAQPAKTTTYTLTVFNEEGCSSVDEVTITVINEVFIPNAFSPNNDGINDEWEIFNIEIFPECKVAIYDRWGNTLFESKGYKTSWDGKFQGQVLPPGSYAYVIRLSGAHKPVSGTLRIIR